MSKYLYIYHYTPEEKDLCRMEHRVLFGQDLTSQYVFSDIEFDYTRSVFIRGRLDIIQSSLEFDDIVQFVSQQNYYFEDFKVVYLKNHLTRIDYQESLDKCRMIAYPISGSVNMRKPQIEFAITCIDNRWYFGVYHHQSLWNKHENKPHSYSHSLSLRMARTLVNIGVGHDLSLKVVDPCCGVGTVVLEALSMGIDIKGYDINRYVSYQARLNLEYYGYNPLVIEKKDMCQLEQVFDVAIMDIPYGVYTPFEYEQQIELLQSASHLANRLILVTHIPMDSELRTLGYCIKDKIKIIKGTFERYITLCTMEERI